MTNPFENEDGEYLVLVNHEEQYSLWPAFREIPAGWSTVGPRGKRKECLDWIEANWTDMRPKSLRDAMDKDMEERARQPVPPPPPPSAQADTVEDSLVKRLAQGSHPIAAGLHPEDSVQALKDGIDRGFVHIKFIATKGGTELGVRLDTAACDFSRADFDTQTGAVHLEGGLILDYVRVRCIAEIDLATLAGQGHLEIVEA